MPTNILMPALSPTMEEGKLAKWLKAEGDMVEAGDVIAEIETDKATMEVEAVDEGKLGRILIAEGTEGVKVNTPIAVLLEEGESAGDIASNVILSDSEESQVKAEDSSPAAQNDIKKTQTALTTRVSASNGTDKGSRVFASPLARRLAAQMGIDLSQVRGSGPHGRIVRADLGDGHTVPDAAPTAAKPSVLQTPKAPASPTIATAPSMARDLADKLGMAYTASENSGMRKVIARRLLEAKQTIPHFYLTIECRIDNLLAARKEINDQANGAYKLSVNDFIVKACANALQAYPAANVSWADDVLLQYAHSDISVAVATDQGLITPIVKAAENKGLRQISEEVKELAARARDGKLKPEEFQGGTFTVSNLGMYGIKEFSAIINPPQSCILAVGAGEQRPFVEDGEIRIGTFMTCTLSTDHRSVDGAVGAQFLQILKQYIESPISMLL